MLRYIREEEKPEAEQDAGRVRVIFTDSEVIENKEQSCLAQSRKSRQERQKKRETYPGVEKKSNALLSFASFAFARKSI